MKFYNNKIVICALSQTWHCNTIIAFCDSKFSHVWCICYCVLYLIILLTKIKIQTFSTLYRTILSSSTYFKFSNTKRYFARLEILLFSKVGYRYVLHQSLLLRHFMEFPEIILHCYGNIHVHTCINWRNRIWLCREKWPYLRWIPHCLFFFFKKKIWKNSPWK